MQAAMSCSKRKKHIDVKYECLRELVIRRNVRISFVAAKRDTASMLSKEV